MAALRLEARSRERRSVIIGSIMTIAGGVGATIITLVILGVGRLSGTGSVGKGALASVMMLAFGVFLLATTRRTTRWRKACEAVISQRAHKPFTCPACNYDMGGLKPGVPCPECGTMPPAEPPLDVRPGF
ncbi:MAG: hypothetical protein QM783_01460 [Phycisphaerales bacterium]